MNYELFDIWTRDGEVKHDFSKSSKIDFDRFQIPIIYKNINIVVTKYEPIRDLLHSNAETENYYVKGKPLFRN